MRIPRLHSYWTATVTSARLLASPTCNTTDCAPVPTAIGTRAFTWMTPETNPGASPAYRTSASTPPIVTDTGSSIRANGTPFIDPPPVPYSTTTDPAAAGLPAALIDP